jgi:hypothetical protein
MVAKGWQELVDFLIQAVWAQARRTKRSGLHQCGVCEDETGAIAAVCLQHGWSGEIMSASRSCLFRSSLDTHGKGYGVGMGGGERRALGLLCGCVRAHRQPGLVSSCLLRLSAYGSVVK